MAGFNMERFRVSMMYNLALVGMRAFNGMALVMVIVAVVSLIKVISGELAVVHVLAMLGIATGFGLPGALCTALADSYDPKMPH